MVFQDGVDDNTLMLGQGDYSAFTDAEMNLIIEPMHPSDSNMFKMESFEFGTINTRD